jgi:deoxycytidine triphosphate deaminase
MILGPKKLLQLVKKIKLVENLDKRELTTPEGAGFDIRLGEVHSIDGGKAYLGITHRETPRIETVISFSKSQIINNKSQTNLKSKIQKITIKPGEFYLLSSIETFNIPLDLTVNFKPRTTLFRSGLFLRTGNVAPGYHGKVTFAVKNEGPIPVTMELGCRFAHAQFFQVEGGGTQYKGQWQGGRVTTKRREKQI